jgi:glycosyltransferase involved in cell wall biosynthesis
VLSVIVPVYNERNTLGKVLVAISGALPTVPKEILIVDDCSKDGTREWLKTNFPYGGQSACRLQLDETGNLVFPTETGESTIFIRPIYHEQNKGKGAGVRTGLAAMAGDIVIIQDADLEYDPHDWELMYDLIAVRGVADVVYGSRFHGRPHRSLYYHHYLANRMISVIFNILYNQTLTDIETCYKMMAGKVARSLKLTANDFGIEVQISAQIALRRKWRWYEVGICYYGRSYDEGKKINWRDGIKALWYLLKFRVC